MKAIIQNQYGSPDVLVPGMTNPPQVRDHDVLVEIYASTVTQGDRRLRAADFPGIGMIPGRIMMGILRPKHRIPGTVFAGIVRNVGGEVSRFQVGDRVFGMCAGGAYSQLIALAEDSTISKAPDRLTFAELASVPYGAISAKRFVKDLGEVGAGSRVLVIGAAGGVGRWAVQVAKSLDAVVHGLCKVNDHVVVQKLGADDAFEDAPLFESYDLILDTSSTWTFRRAAKLLKANGRFVSSDMSLRLILNMALNAIRPGPKAIFGIVESTSEDLDWVASRLANSKLKPTPIRTYPLSKSADAHRAFESERLRGEIIIQVREEAKATVPKRDTSSLPKKVASA